jgi:hypothetical protein
MSEINRENTEFFTIEALFGEASCELSVGRDLTTPPAFSFAVAYFVENINSRFA